MPTFAIKPLSASSTMMVELTQNHMDGEQKQSSSELAVSEQNLNFNFRPYSFKMMLRPETEFKLPPWVESFFLGVKLNIDRLQILQFGFFAGNKT